MREIRVKLPELMAQRRINRKQLAEATGLRYATLSDVYTGKRRPTLETLEVVLNGLEQLSGKKVDLWDVLELAETVSDETIGWDAASVTDLSRALDDLEADEHPEEVRAWLAAFEEAAK